MKKNHFATRCSILFCIFPICLCAICLKYEGTVAAFWREISRHLSNGPNVTSRNRWRYAILYNVLRQTTTVSCSVAPLALIEQTRIFGNRAPAYGWWPLWVCIFLVVVVVVNFYKKLYFIGYWIRDTRYVLFCLMWFFASHQQSFSFVGAGLPGLNKY